MANAEEISGELSRLLDAASDLTDDGERADVLARIRKLQKPLLDAEDSMDPDVFRNLDERSTKIIRMLNQIFSEKIPKGKVESKKKESRRRAIKTTKFTTPEEASRALEAMWWEFYETAKHGHASSNVLHDKTAKFIGLLCSLDEDTLKKEEVFGYDDLKALKEESEKLLESNNAEDLDAFASRLLNARSAL